MGKKLDMLLGKSNKSSSKLRMLSKLTLSRIPFLKKQYQARLSQEHSDVIQLLSLGHHDRALLRVELVMKDQSMLDALLMVEGYCEVLVERAMLIKKHVECPEEMKEAASGLIFAASRCGKLPELHELRGVLTKLYGKEFAARVIELRSGCGVNPRIIRRLSARTPSLESRLQVLGEIAGQNGIILPLTNSNKEIEADTEHDEQVELNLDISRLRVNNTELPEQCFKDTSSLTEVIDSGMAYQDAVAAAQDAFLSAAFAAAAARAAVELSRMDTLVYDQMTNRPFGYETCL